MSTRNRHAKKAYVDEANVGQYEHSPSSLQTTGENLELDTISSSSEYIEPLPQMDCILRGNAGYKHVIKSRAHGLLRWIESDVARSIPLTPFFSYVLMC